MIIDLDNWLHVVVLSVVTLLSCVGAGTLACLIAYIKKLHPDLEIKDADYYVGCDMRKVNKF